MASRNCRASFSCFNLAPRSIDVDRRRRHTNWPTKSIWREATVMALSEGCHAYLYMDWERFISMIETEFVGSQKWVSLHVHGTKFVSLAAVVRWKKRTNQKRFVSCIVNLPTRQFCRGLTYTVSGKIIEKKFFLWKKDLDIDWPAISAVLITDVYSCAHCISAVSGNGRDDLCLMHELRREAELRFA